MSSNLLALGLGMLGLSAVVLAALDLWRVLSEPAALPSPPQKNAPSVSVLIPARNESRGIEALLAGLARQTLPPIEVCVVDDASEDDTAAKVEGWVGKLPGLRLIRGEPLPEGWMGKPWALTQAARTAGGELFLFLDADLVPEAALVASLVEVLERDGADVLTGFPRTQLGGLWERLVLPAFHAVLFGLYPVRKVGADSRRALINGQCWLVRRSAYERIDGHRAVWNSVLEDVHLAQRFAGAGFRLRARTLFNLLTARAYADGRALREGVSKHAPSGFQSGGTRSTWIGLQELILALTPPVAFGATLAATLTEAPTRGLPWLFGGALLAMLRGGVLYRRRYDSSAAWGLGLWLGTWLYFALATRAFMRARSTNGLTWKGRPVGPQ